MKRIRNSGNFFFTFLVNMILNLKWTIPAWLLLACHFLFDWKILWFWIALGVWLLDILLWMSIMGWAAKCGNEKDPPRENKNPYSQTNDTFNKKNNG